MEAMRKSGASVRDSRFNHPPYVPEDDKPIEPSGVVDPSATAVDPNNEKFMPSNRDELKMAVQTMLSDIDDLEIPRTYQLIKKSIDKMREEQKMKNMSSVDEAVIRHVIRKLLKESPMVSAPRSLMIDKYADDQEIIGLVVKFMPSALKDKDASQKKKKLANLQQQVERKLKSKGLKVDVAFVAGQVIDKILDPLNAAARDEYLSTHDVTKLATGKSSAYGPGDPSWQKDVESLRATLKTMSFDDTEKGAKKEVDGAITVAAYRIIKKSEDPVNSVKKTARWLKDNVAGDIGQNLMSVIEIVKEQNPEFASKMLAVIEAEPKLVPKGKEAKTGDVSRDEIAKGVGVKYGTNVRDIENVAFRKFKDRISPEASVSDAELSESVEIAVMYALKDFLKVIPGADLYSDEDIEVFKQNPAIAAELPIFRVFLNGYLDGLDIDDFIESPQDSGLRAGALESGLAVLKKELKKEMGGETSGELSPSVTDRFNQ